MRRFFATIATVLSSPGTLVAAYRQTNRFPWLLVGVIVGSVLVLVLGLAWGSLPELPIGEADPVGSPVLSMVLLVLLAGAASAASLVFQSMLVSWPRALIGDERRFASAAVAVVAANTVLAVRNSCLGFAVALSLVAPERIFGVLTLPYEPFGLYSVAVFYMAYTVPADSRWRGWAVRLVATGIFCLVTVGVIIVVRYVASNL